MSIIDLAIVILQYLQQEQESQCFFLSIKVFLCYGHSQIKQLTLSHINSSVDQGTFQRNHHDNTGDLSRLQRK
jgi:hypothetical protein